MRTDVAVNAKLAPDLAAWLRAEAKANARSLTGQLSWIVQQARKAALQPKEKQQ